MIDTHAHLSDRIFEKKVEEVVGEARAAGVEKIIVPSVSLRDAVRVRRITEKYEGLYGLVGVHPEEVINNPEIEVEVEALVRTIERDKKVVGIGEVGLDFYWDKKKKTKNEQMRLLEMQLRLAEAMRLPVVIHMRAAEREMVEVLEKIDHLPRGQFHCWSGGKEFLQWVLKKDFYVSFCGNMTYGNSELPKLVKQVPPNRLLLETDSPYLAPSRFKGEINRPKNVRIIASFLADLFGKSVREIEGITDRNAKNLFNKID